ncbi:MAG TPA: hypothetical protein DDW50_18225 [Firmicutes bacterium]|jgi:hypothetical protein|nr:hypothetical protein [Bacillota bacterium]
MRKMVLLMGEMISPMNGMILWIGKTIPQVEEMIRGTHLPAAEKYFPNYSAGDEEWKARRGFPSRMASFYIIFR